MTNYLEVTPDEQGINRSIGIFDSLVFKIGFLLIMISIIALVSMVSAVYISDNAQTDAHAINLSGSMRMQSYLILNKKITNNKSEEIDRLISDFEKKLSNPVLMQATKKTEKKKLHDAIWYDWNNEIKPLILDSHLTNQKLNKLEKKLNDLVTNIDHLVKTYQVHAEDNNRLIRQIQAASLLITISFIFLAIYMVNHLIRRPLSDLTIIATKIGQGDYTVQADEHGHDELSILAKIINRMVRAINDSHIRMEEKVRKKTKQLERTNESIQLLYSISNKSNHSHGSNIDFQPHLSKLSEVTGIEGLELCLMTENGTKPYHHLNTKKSILPLSCRNRDCSDCVSFDSPLESEEAYTFPLVYDHNHFGVLNCVPRNHEPLKPWQSQLIQSVAEQFAITLSLKHRQDESRRLALARERTVIARELHDSLAQALSYLKIQVAVLQKGLTDPSVDISIENTISDIKTALNGAYKELRELLTTFRLKLEGSNLHEALQESFKQLSDRFSDKEIKFNNEIKNMPFSATEQVHLLQIAREAVQNAIHHSEGSKIVILLTSRKKNGYVTLLIHDDGIGIDTSAKKENHYGLAIMKERSRSLKGTLTIGNHAKGGTEVRFDFQPEFNIPLDVEKTYD